MNYQQPSHNKSCGNENWTRVARVMIPYGQPTAIPRYICAQIRIRTFPDIIHVTLCTKSFIIILASRLDFAWPHKTPIQNYPTTSRNSEHIRLTEVGIKPTRMKSHSPTNHYLYFLAIMFPVSDNHNTSFQELRTSELGRSSTTGEIRTLTRVIPAGSKPAASTVPPQWHKVREVGFVSYNSEA